MNTGQIVRSWPMRGTLHLVAAEDLEWMLTLLTPRVVTGSVGRRTGLGLSQAQLERARETAVSALSGGEQLSRSELFHVWDEAGLSTQGQRGAHMLSFLAMTGTLVFGPMRSESSCSSSPRNGYRVRAGWNETRHWVSWRFGTFAATAQQLWPISSGGAQLLVTDARTGVAVAGDDLVTMEVDGIDYLLDPRLPDRLAKVRADAERVLLLPGFDEFVLGYKDRSAQLDLPSPTASCLVATGCFGPRSSAAVECSAPGSARTAAGSSRSRRRRSARSRPRWPPRCQGCSRRSLSRAGSSGAGPSAGTLRRWASRSIPRRSW
jgi:hypothetical protein